MAVKSIKINGRMVSARAGESILEAAEDAGIHIPRLCHVEGVSDVAACRMCLVKVEGNNKFVPACMTPVEEEMIVETETPKLQEYRRMIVELLFAEGNHVCAVCVVNGNCQLQDLAIEVGMDHSRFEYRFPVREFLRCADRPGLPFFRRSFARFRTSAPSQPGREYICHRIHPDRIP